MATNYTFEPKIIMKSSTQKYFLYARKSSESEDRQILSIPSQVDELKRLARQSELPIADILTEEKSAKAPGRPVFNQMLERIQQGEADGIICWKLDRLARNPIDGGNINWMLQQGIIKHIQTFQRSYYPADNVLMMNLEFGMANQFILDLSVNTKRGMNSKIKDGWLPHKPPIGYLNNKYNHPDFPPIYKDPERFDLIKHLWDYLIETGCTIEHLYQKSQRMGIKTDKDKKIGKSSFHSLFRNPFYYGHIRWKDEIYPGKHEPMICKQQFDSAQTILDGKSKPRKQIHEFAFTGLMRCGECGAAITAENKTKHQKNGNIHHYTYYRCTKRIDPKCSQKPIRDTELEKQIVNVLGKIEIPVEFHKWAIKHLKEEQSKEIDDREKINDSQRKQVDDCDRKLDQLFDMRLNNEITSEEFSIKKAQLLEEKTRFEEILKDSSNRVKDWLDRAEEVFQFAETARERFETGDLHTKKEILSCLGSNLLLKDRKLDMTLEKSLALFPTHAPEVRELHNRLSAEQAGLEPPQHVEKQAFYEDFYSKNQKWGRWLEDVRTCLMLLPTT